MPIRFNSYAGARQGILSGLGNIMGAGMNRQSGYDEALRTAAYADQGRASADKSRAETDILHKRAGGYDLITPDAVEQAGLGPLARAVMLAGVDPAAGYENVMKGRDVGNQTDIRNQAAERVTGHDTETANLLSAISAGKTYDPFSASESGVLNGSSGALAPTDLSRSVVGKNDAAATSSYAQGRNFDASGREHDAGARAKGIVNGPAGSSFFFIDQLLGGIPTPGGVPPGAQPSMAPQPPVDTMGMEDVPGLAQQAGVGGSVLDALSKIATPDAERALSAPGGAAPRATGPAPLATAPGGSAKATQLMQNLEAAGLKPGTPEYQKMMLQSVTKTGTNKPPAGYRVDPNDPEKLAPIAGGPGDPKNKPLSEGQSKAVMFATRADAMDKQLSSSKYDPTTKEAAWDRSLIGGTLTNWMASKQGQVYVNQGRNFVAAVLRKESGATITESEWTQGQQLYIPMPGDDKDVIAQKKYNRNLAIEGIKAEAGDAIGRVKVPMAPGETPADGSPAIGTIEDGHRFLGGDPGDPKNWEAVQ